MRTFGKPWLRGLWLPVATVTAMMHAGSAFAAFPEQSVRIIAAFPAGGATDAIARVVASELSTLWGQTVMVENRTGAGGNIGANYVAKSPADGYTLLMASPAETVINPLLYSQMQYDAEKDLTPVSQAGSAPLLLVAHPSVPARNVKELVDYARQNAGKVSYASSGTGGPQHLAGEQFKLMTETDILHIPYKGGAPAITDLVGGQVHIFFAGLPPALPFVREGKATALAVTTKDRSELIPEVPTLVESGLSDFDIENWQGVFAPGGTPPEIVDEIAAALRKVLDRPDVKEKLANLGISAAPSTPGEFKKFIQRQRTLYTSIIEAANITIQQ